MALTETAGAKLAKIVVKRFTVSGHWVGLVGSPETGFFSGLICTSLEINFCGCIFCHVLFWLIKG